MQKWLSCERNKILVGYAFEPPLAGIIPRTLGGLQGIELTLGPECLGEMQMAEHARARPRKCSAIVFEHMG